MEPTIDLEALAQDITRNGFAVVPDVIGGELLERAQTAIDRIIETMRAEGIDTFSETLDPAAFPIGSNWLMLGPSGPRRLRLAVEHLAQHLDVDPELGIGLEPRAEGVELAGDAVRGGDQQVGRCVGGA